MKNMVYIEKDENGGIVACKDGTNGIVVQLVAFIDQMKSTGIEGTMTNVRTVQVLSSKAVSLGEGFREEVDKAVSSMKEVAANLKIKHNTIDSLLNDFRSQSKELNEQEASKE